MHTLNIRQRERNPGQDTTYTAETRRAITRKERHFWVFWYGSLSRKNMYIEQCFGSGHFCPDPTQNFFPESGSGSAKNPDPYP